MKFLKYLLLLIVLLVVAVVGTIWWVLFTQGGRDFAVGKVNAYTATLATPVVLGKLEGSVLHDARLQSLTVADVGGVWLTVEGVRLVWHPLKLLDGTAPFERLEVSRTLVTRLPVAVSESEVKEDTAPVNPLEYAVYIPRQVALNDVTVGAAVTGKEHRLRAVIGGLGGVREISVSTLEGPLTTVSGTVAFEAMDAGRVDVELREAAQGLIGGLLKLPQTAEIRAKVVGALRGQDVSVTLLDVQAGEAGASRLVASGEGVKDGSRLQGKVAVDSDNLAQWQGLLGTPLRGKLHGVAEVSGSLAALGVSVGMTDTDLAVSETRVAGLAAQVRGMVNATDMKTLPFALQGLLNGKVNGVGKGEYPIALGLDVSGTLQGAGGEVSGTMTRKGERAEIRVKGAGVVSPLMVSGTVAGRWVQGKNTFVVNGGVDVNPVQAVLTGVNLVGPGTVVSGSGVVNLASLLVDGRAMVRVADLRPLAALGGVVVTGGLDADVVVQGKNGVQVGDATVRKFDIQYDTYKALLKKPARLVWDGKTGSLSPFELEIAGGTVTAQGRLNEQLVAANLTVKDVDLTELMDNDVVAGKVNAAAVISGRPDKPVVTLTGDFAGKTGTYPLGVKVTGDWRNAVLKIGAVGTSGTTSATADVSLGGTLSLMPFEMGIGTGSTLRGKVDARMPLDVFNPILWPSRQQVGGVIAGAATLGGTLGAPEANGRFKLSDGSYTQSTSGVCLKDISAEIVASRDTVTVDNLLSKDGVGGTMTGSARVGLQGKMPLSAQVGLQKLRIFCGGLAVGTVDGNLGVEGVVADHTVRGTVLVGPLNVQVPGASRDADIPQVEVVRVSGKEAGGTDIITRLAVTVDAPQRVYVRGRGVDAEFGGKIEVSGTADNPILTGSMKALRGRYTLLDRTLELGDTSIRFEGPIPPSPYLDVKATTRAQGTDITVAITGSATKPQLTLTSEPSKPQDEILALLLFGRSLGNISPFEAIKLAQATRVLAGLDSGEPGILDKARKTLGVDTLDIGSSGDSGDVTVTTGKYVTEDVYVSVKQGTEPADRQIKTEVELTPSITGNTTIDGEGSQSVGVEWKHDY